MNRLLIVTGILFTVIFSSCKNEEKHEEEHVKFLVTSPIKMDTVVTKEYVCQIHAISHIELRAQEKGYLESIYIDEGQHVKKGQLFYQQLFP